MGGVHITSKKGRGKQEDREKCLGGGGLGTVVHKRT